MASRQSTGVASSQNGLSYASGQAAAGGAVQIDIGLSTNPAVTLTTNSNSALATLIGTTINSLVVGPLELWSDGGVWDTTNSRFLRPVIDFDVTLLHRSGFGG